MTDTLSQWEALAKELIEERGNLRTKTSVMAQSCLRLISVVRKQREALEFYASLTRWGITTHESTYDGIPCNDFQSFKSIATGPTQVGGKKAREALAEAERILSKP